MDSLKPTLFGPCTQILTLRKVSSEGPLTDEALDIIEEGGLLVERGHLKEVAPYAQLKQRDCIRHELPRPCVAVPGLIDAHTHLCHGGSRARDYALRLSGITYQEIAARGGGIHDTVAQTRKASKEELKRLLSMRSDRLLREGVTTCEVKSGYGLSLLDEQKMLHAITEVSHKHAIDLIPTCLAAHVVPKEFSSETEYLTFLQRELLPTLQPHCRRIDIFVENNAFSLSAARSYLQFAKQKGFALTLHADQFTPGGAQLAAELGALSADHLEVSGAEDILALKKGGVIPVVLPGASLGLGLPFAPARRLLDAGLPLVIASDWNPGSAPMGKLLTQAALLAAYEKLSMAETWAALTCRAARALNLTDRGVLAPGTLADVTFFPTHDYREILYQQGSLTPTVTLKKGRLAYETLSE